MSETIWRLSVFIGVLLVMVLWEFLAPKRKPRYSRKQRWTANLAIVAVDTVLLRVIAPVGLTGIALWASEQEWGLFHYLSGTAGNELPFWFVVLVSIVALDIVLYWQNRLFHRIPVLWRMHRVHHADPDFDVTTGLRFHPAEIVLSFFIKAAAILVLGAPALAVIVFEIILNACSLSIIVFSTACFSREISSKAFRDSSHSRIQRSALCFSRSTVSLASIAVARSFAARSRNSSSFASIVSISFRALRLIRSTSSATTSN